MTISFDKAFGVYESAIKLRSQRANLLAGNMANADTPNYKARDIDFHQALKDQRSYKTQSNPGITHQNHMQVSQFDSGSAERMYRIPNQPSVDGNTVDEHTEHAEFMQNTLEFQVAFQVLNSSIKGISKAIRGEL